MRQITSNRRAFIRGSANVALGLPIAYFAMRGSKVSAQALTPTKRLLTFYFPGGMKPEFWNFGATNGALMPLASRGLQNVVTPIQNLSFPAAATYAGNGMNPHAIGAGALFSGNSIPLNVAAARVQSGGATIDWIASQLTATTTPVKGISLSLDAPDFSPDPMMGLHEETVSWINATTPNRPIFDPLRAFNLIFGGVVQDQTLRQRQLLAKKSLLDHLIEQYRSLGSENSSVLGKQGSSLLRQHFEELREMEKAAVALINAPSSACGNVPPTPLEISKYSYADYERVFALHRNILMAAMKCDLLRFANLSFSGAVSNMLLPGYAQDNHNAAHFSSDGQSYANYFYYVRYFVDQFAILMQQMHAEIESNGNSMLENSCIVMGTEMGDGIRHDFSNLNMLIGGGKGFFPNTIVNANQRPVNDVLTSALRFLGLNQINSVGNPQFNQGSLFG